MGRLVPPGPDDERRWDDIEAALGQIADTGHEWDDDPARLDPPSTTRRRPWDRLTVPAQGSAGLVAS